MIKQGKTRWRKHSKRYTTQILFNQTWKQRSIINNNAVSKRINDRLMQAHKDNVYQVRIINQLQFPYDTPLPAMLFSALRNNPLPTLLSEINVNSLQLRQEEFELLLTRLSHCYLLTKFNLIKCTLNTLQIRNITQCQWKYMTEFQLSKNNITSEGVRMLRMRSWQYLKRLSLSGNPIQNRGAQQLVKLEAPKLTMLRLRKTGMTDRAIRVLVKGQWSVLQYLDLKGNHLYRQAHQLLLQGNYAKMTTIDVEGYQSLLHLNSFAKAINISQRLVILDYKGSFEMYAQKVKQILLKRYVLLYLHN